MSQNKKNNKNQKKGYYKKDTEYQPELEEKDIKYEISSSDEEPPDFSYLLNLHASSTSHLILKSDQEKFHRTESVINTSKYFNVDLNILNSAIKSLPFHEIHNIEGIEWSNDEINQMNEVSKVNEEIYKTLLANLEHNQSSDNSNVEKVTTKVVNLKVSSPQKEKKVSQAVDGSNKESMEKWLDDVLDL